MRATSLDAYFSIVLPTLGDRQKQVLDALKTKESATNAELATMLCLPINCITPRIKELRDKGYVRKLCTRECRSTRHTAIAWEVVPRSPFQLQMF